MYRTILWKQSLPVLVTFGPQQLCLPSENVTEDRDEKYNQTNFIANVKAELMKNEYVFTAIDWFISTLLEGSFESQQCDQKWCWVGGPIKLVCSYTQEIFVSHFVYGHHQRLRFKCNFPFSTGLNWLFQSYLLKSIRSAVDCTLLLKVGVGVTVVAVAFLWNMICLHLNFRLRDPQQIARYTMAMYSSLYWLIQFQWVVTVE